MSRSDSTTCANSQSEHAIVVGQVLPENAAEILLEGDLNDRRQLAKHFPELVISLFRRDAVRLTDKDGVEIVDEEAVLQSLRDCITVDHCDLNPTELFNWFTRHEQAELAQQLLELWRARDIDVAATDEWHTLHFLSLDAADLNPDQGCDISMAAASVALASGPISSGVNAAALLNAASGVTGFSVVDIEGQAANILDAISGADDALGFGALTLARQPAVGEPGVSCNRALLNVLCGDCRARAHHNALDTLRNRLQTGQLRATEMLDHLLAAIKNCGGIRRVHLLEADLVAGVLRSRRRLHVRGAVPFRPLEVAIGAAPALEALMTSPQTRVVSPDAVHPDVAALAESPLMPATHSVVGSLLVEDRPQAVVIVDAEGLPVSAADADRIHELVQLGGKLLSLLSSSENGWHQSREVSRQTLAAANS